MPHRPIPQLTDRQRERFHGSYTRGAPGGCWVWWGVLNKKGYGHFQMGASAYRAHRLSYALHTGRDPGDLLVCHRCDNPPCVNPEHLWLGTASENLRDMHSKGRRPFARRNIFRFSLAMELLVASEAVRASLTGAPVPPEHLSRFVAAIDAARAHVTK